MDHISIIEEGSKGPYTRAINVLVKLRNAPFEYLSRHSNFGKILFSLVLFVLYNAYLIGCIVRKVQYILGQWALILATDVYFANPVLVFVTKIILTYCEKKMFNALSLCTRFSNFGFRSLFQTWKKIEFKTNLIFFRVWTWFLLPV